MVGANVFHATKDLDQSIENALSLLAPGGLLLLFETTTQPTWFESSIGLIEGWSRFEDEWRQDDPLLSTEQWKKALQTHRFGAVASWPQPGLPTELLGAHIILAQAPFDRQGTNTDTSDTPESIQMRTAAQEVKSSIDSPQPGSDAATLVQQLKEATPDEQESILIDYVRDHVMKVTRSDPANPPDRRQRLMDFGVDSLMAVELRNRLSKGLGLTQPLPATLIFDYPTIEVIARYLASQVIGTTSDNVVLVISANDPTNTMAARQAELADLSEEETEALLLKALKDVSDDD